MIDDFVRRDQCVTCPFHETGPGRELRDGLQSGRFEGIITALRAEKIFPCHELPTRGKRMRHCAGALAYQRKHGCVPSGVQIVERLTAMKEGRRARW